MEKLASVDGAGVSSSTCQSGQLAVRKVTACRKMTGKKSGTQTHQSTESTSVTDANSTITGRSTESTLVADADETGGSKTKGNNACRKQKKLYGDFVLYFHFIVTLTVHCSSTSTASSVL